MAKRWTRECEQARWDWLTTAFGKLQNGTRGVQYIRVVRKMWCMAFFYLARGVTPRGWWSYGVWVFNGIIDLHILRPYTISQPSPSPRDVESATFPTKQKSSFGLIIRTRGGDPIPNRLKSYGFEFGRNKANVPEFGKTQGKLAIFYKKLHRKNS